MALVDDSGDILGKDWGALGRTGKPWGTEESPGEEQAAERRLTEDWEYAKHR